MKELTWIDNKKICIIASDLDIASMIIATEVEKLGLPVVYLRDKSFLHCSEQDLPPSDIYIILSRHSSAAGEPAFTVHSVGNFSPEVPRLGGQAATLGKTHAEIQTFLLHSIAQNLNEKFSHFDVVAEATHHGPLLDKPVIFFEMGSSQAIWSSKQAAIILALSLDYFFSNYSSNHQALPVAIGFGGGHYPRKIATRMLDLEYAVGHLCPKYALPFVNQAIVEQMVFKTQTSSKVEFALFDKKGMSRKQEIKEMVENLGLDVVSI